MTCLLFTLYEISTAFRLNLERNRSSKEVEISFLFLIGHPCHLPFLDFHRLSPIYVLFPGPNTFEPPGVGHMRLLEGRQRRSSNLKEKKVHSLPFLINP